MRFRKPCVRLRRMRLGWYVRLTGLLLVGWLHPLKSIRFAQNRSGSFPEARTLCQAEPPPRSAHHPALGPPIKLGDSLPDRVDRPLGARPRGRRAMAWARADDASGVGTTAGLARGCAPPCATAVAHTRASDERAPGAAPRAQGGERGHLFRGVLGGTSSDRSPEFPRHEPGPRLKKRVVRG
jgi:hypothetical protein